MAGLLGAVAGAVGGLLLAPESGRKTREKISKLANEIYKQIRVGVVETEHKVKEIYGTTAKTAKESYQSIEKAVAEKVASVKEAGEAIDKEKYITIVEKVVAEYKDDFKATKNGAEKMMDLLKKDWERVKKALISPPKEKSEA